jgi:hypothetical protein
VDRRLAAPGIAASRQRKEKLPVPKRERRNPKETDFNL